MNQHYIDENEPQVITCMIIVIFLIIGFGFVLGWACGCARAETDMNNNICKYLYSNTNDYLQCSTKYIDENIKLIKYIK